MLFKQGGVHNPMAELLYPQFCEALVRLAALRYRHLPGLEKRLHTLIQVHLLHQVCGCGDDAFSLLFDVWSG